MPALAHMRDLVRSDGVGASDPVVASMGDLLRVNGESAGDPVRCNRRRRRTPGSPNDLTRTVEIVR
jgi:hypothetical protein